MKKTIRFACLTFCYLVFSVTLFAQQLRVIPQTSALARELLTNETAAGWAAIIELGTNFNFADFPLLDGTNIYSGPNAFTNPANSFAGTYSGSAIGLSNVSAQAVQGQLHYGVTPQTSDIGGSAFSQWNYASTIISYNQTNYDTYRIHCGTVLKRGGKIYVFYGVDTAIGTTNQGFIAVASGLDFYHLSLGGIVFTNSTSGWDSNHVQGPRMYTESGTNYMFYFGGTAVGFEGAPNSIGVAYQADTTNWTPSGWTRYPTPLLIPGPGNFDVEDCWRPYIVKNNGTYFLYYNGKGIDGYERIGFATSTNIFGPYVKYVGNPVIDDTGGPNGDTQDPTILRLTDGNYILLYSQCCNALNMYAGTAWSHDLTNWTVVNHAPINNYPPILSAGQSGAQSFELFMDDGPKILWDDVQNIYVGSLAGSISGSKQSVSSTNVNATNLNAGATSTTTLNATNAKFGTLNLSGFNLTNYYSPTLWLKADSIAGIIVGDGFNTWFDSSGHALNATSAFGFNQPAYEVDNIGPYVFLVNSSVQTASITTGTNLTVIALMSAPWATPSYGSILTQGYGAGSGKGFFVASHAANDWGSDNIYFVGNGFTSGNAPRAFGPYGNLTNNQDTIVTVTLSASRSRVWVNGVAVSTNEMVGNVPNTTGVLEIGSAVGTGDTFNGRIRELIVLPTAIADIDRQVIEAYLANKWNLQYLTPPGTPFSSVFPIQAQSIIGTFPTITVSGASTLNGPVIAGAQVTATNPNNVIGGASGTFTGAVTASSFTGTGTNGSLIAVGTFTVTNSPTFGTTNPAPSNTNGPKIWISFTNGGSVYKFGGYQ